MRGARVRSAALALALAGCGGAAPPVDVGDRAIGNRGGDDAARLIGRYACQIEQGGWRYPLYACEIRSERGRLWLRKLEGQMLLDGEVTPDAAGGFAWRGQVRCTWTTTCAGAVAQTFTTLPGGVGYEAALPAYDMGGGALMPAMVVTIVTEAHAVGQGGVRYGGYGTGGWTGGAFSGEVPVQ